ncbi:MAG: NlpC/P60 family protein [Albidovulum sp.]|nr:NlpC/P60 family protein [Albidovulum sp.]
MTASRGRAAVGELRGNAGAAGFVDGELVQFAAPFASLRSRPGGELATQALFGERFRVLEAKGDEAYGQLARDGYAGYVSRERLVAPRDSTHRIAAISSHFYAAPDIRSPARQGPTLGGEICASAEANGFLEVEDEGFIPAAHARELSDRPTDFVAVAEKFEGAPYLWGGKTCFGIDCSGLLQLSLHQTGMRCPRDSDLQAMEFSTSVGRGAPRERGDLAFWKGHVGILADAENLLHATARGMAVVVEPFEQARNRIESLEGNPFLGIRRI